MADKTTTLKTKTNDNVYPNIIGDNRDNAIVDSAHINHTLTAAHKINFRLDTNVSKLIFNSLQKPTGLTKTKLVGVGTNGQENIEIGDNLTLANGKLSASGGGGGGDLYWHCVRLAEISPDNEIIVNFYAKSNENVNTIDLLKKYLLDTDNVVCSGYVTVGDHYAMVYSISKNGTYLIANHIDLTNGNKDIYYLSHIDMIKDTPIPVK